ncbi:MAG: hypothetical protein E6G08_20705 [Actinobacteria bacterium]|nr:MAG: hypothetical protein E6G08_20705 [Actinomycetota bacterium]
MIAVACPPLSRPPKPELIAITRMFAACSAAIASARLWPFDGSWLGASPNQAMIRDESARQPTFESVASR